MSYQIINNGPSLKIIYDGQELSISKRSIQEVAVIREDVIKMDTEDNCHSFYLRRSLISEPVSVSAADLINQMNVWITDCSCCNCNEVEDEGGIR